MDDLQAGGSESSGAAASAAAKKSKYEDLSVEEKHGRVVVRGEAPTYYAKQRALHGALDVLPGERIDAGISVDGG